MNRIFLITLLLLIPSTLLAKENVKEIHNRQPVILNQSDVKQYLNIELQGSIFLIERKVPDLNYYEISKDVNKPANNSASLVQPVLK